MAKYISRFERLSFYVDGEREQFVNGIYRTDDEKVIAVLDGLTDATRVDEAKAEQKTEEAPKTKPKAPAKKTSAK